MSYDDTPVVEEKYVPATGSFIPRQIVLGMRDGDAYEKLTDGSYIKLSTSEAIMLHQKYPVEIAPLHYVPPRSIASQLSRASAEWIHNNLLTLLANAKASAKIKKRWKRIADARLAELQEGVK